jgi:Transposase DDE domain
MFARATATVRQFATRRSEEAAAARFFRNDKVSVEEILAEASAQTARSCAGRHVLLVEDTSEINYEAKKGRKRGLGQVGNGTDAGLFVHPVLALDAEDGSIFGLGWARMWQRTKTKRPDYRSQPIEDKESHRWIATAQMACQQLSEASQFTIMADREADIYELFARLPDPRTHVIIRARSDRALADCDGRMLEAIAAEPEAGRITFEMPARTGRPARTVEAAVRFASVRIRQPKIGAGKSDPEAIALNLVQVRESDPPSPDDAVEWNLLTTHEVASLGDAVRIVEYYRLRWSVEQVFRTTKSQGLDIEASFLRDGEALEKLAAVALIVAIRAMQLVHGRGESGHKYQAARVFVPDELAILVHVIAHLEGKTSNQKNPHPPQSLAWAGWAIARLGGWKGYKSERPPGPITFCRGLQRFTAMAEGFRLARDSQS